ncbi:MAG: hypothetical protein IPM82_30200 [Saprospiraceae bacterium]|nr:hypothetical protein [Saprospiraceae bacterium]
MLSCDGRVITLIDTPGFFRFISNIIYGAHLSDLAILVVEGVEAGTINVARILQAFGIPVIAIAVTKMDVVGYSELRYQEICEDVNLQLKNISNNQADFPAIIPVCSLSGEGISKFEKIDWIHSETLVEVIEKARIEISPNRIEDLHFVVEGNHEVHSLSGIGTVVVGSLETGIISKNTKLLLEPISTIEGRLP